MTTSLSPDFKDQSHEFLVVGLGASAGGIQALQEFFEHVPADSNMAYVVILHLSPNHDSKLAEVLQTVSTIPVTQVREKVVVEANHVFVVSPDQHLVLENGFIVPLPNVRVEERRAPVDIFFRSLADAYGPRAVSVVLSGTGANGSMGLKRIKEMGGVTYVQNPREAEFNEMPRNSIATELVDEVLPVAEIPGRIIAYRDSLGTVGIPVEAENRPEQQQQALREIFTHLRLRTGHDFSNYKQATLLRRIERRISVRGLADLPGYAAYLLLHPEESQALLKDLLISVTNFFRDKKPFVALELDVLPAIFSRKNAESEVRVWVAGCATGEEAYSLAMLLADRTWGLLDAPKVQIFATDIDEAAISTAREGLYTLNDAADVSPERLQRYFTKEGDSYRIQRAIREMILFANHNFLKDPPFSRLDLITCRNVLIYLNSTAQERVMETFHFALRPGSYLFLGSAESVDGASDLYATVSRENHLYQARETAMHKYPVPESVPSLQLPPPAPLKLTDPGSPPPNPNRVSFGELHQKLLEQYAPPSLVVNEDYDIIHMSEKAGRFLEFSGGEPTKNLLKLIRPELRLELRSALYQAVQRQTALEARHLPWMWNGERQVVTIHVRPVTKDGDPAKGFVLVLFEPSEQAPGQAGEPVVLVSDEPVAKQLEEELIQVKAQLRNSAEQFEYQAEELKASNEELQAINEELRSAAEELETSKEELQSINEELRTVNQELKVKIEETSVTSNNLQNLINSAGVATIFLDRAFCIRLYTPATLQLFNLIPSDHGRPVSDITHRLAYDALLADAKTVLDKLTMLEREVSTTDGRAYMMRVLPYRTAEDRINGVVITFFDITLRQQAEDARRESEAKYRTLFESIDEGFCIFELLYNDKGAAVDWLYTEANPAFERQTGYRHPIGKRISALQPDLERSWFERFAEVARTGEPVRFVQYTAAMDIWYDVYALRVGAAGDHRVSLLFADITERKRHEENLAFLAEVSDDLLHMRRMEETIALLGGKIGNKFGVGSCNFAELSEDAETVVVTAWNAEGVPSVTGVHKLGDLWTDERRARHGRGEVTVVNDTQVDPRVKAASLAAIKVRSYISVPLARDEAFKFLLAITDAEPREWRADEIELAQELTTRIWMWLERVRAEEALRASEANYAALFAASPVPFMVVAPDAPDFTITAANEAYFAATYSTPADLLGQRMLDVFTVDPTQPGRAGSEVVASSVARVLATKKTDVMARLRYDLVRPSGELEPHWWQAVNAPLFDAAGQVSAIIHQATNVTDLHYAELAEQQRQQQQAFLLELSDALRAEANPETIGQLATRRLAEHLKVDRCHLIRVDKLQQLGWVGPEFHAPSLPDLAGEYRFADFPESMHRLETQPLVIHDLWHDASLSAADQQSIGEGMGMQAALTVALRNGPVNTVWALNVGMQRPRRWSPEEQQLVEQVAERTWAAMQRARTETTLRDFSGQLEQQVAERTTQLHESTVSLQQNLAKLHQAEEAAKMGSWEYDLASGTLSWSAGLYRLFGLPVGSPVRPEIYLDYVVAEDRPRAQRLVQQLREQHAPVDEMLYLRLGGQVRIFRIRSVVLRNDQGVPLKLVGIDLDISEVKRLEEENLHMRLNQQKALLLGILDAQEEERRRIAESLHNGVGQLLYATKLNLERVAKLLPTEATEGTQELLANAIRETRRVSHELVPISLKDFGLANAVKDMCRQFSQASFQTTCEVVGLENRLESYLEVALYRICQELLTNVVKHAAATRADILLILEGGEITLKVRDDGQGISPEPAKPTGIGLRTIRDRVHLLNGTFAIQANPAGRGTQVAIQLPSAEVAPA